MSQAARSTFSMLQEIYRKINIQIYQIFPRGIVVKSKFIQEVYTSF